MFRIMEIPDNGPAPRYTDCDLFFVMKMVEGRQAANRRVSREEIARAADVNIGTVRGIYGKLADMGLVDVFHSGITLTVLGKDMLDALGVDFVPLSATDSAIGKFQAAVRVRGAAGKISKGVEQRNDGLRAGGDGCTAIICRDGRLLLPPDWCVDEKSPQLAAEIRTAGVEDGDVILIGGSDACRRFAIASAVSAAFALV